MQFPQASYKQAAQWRGPWRGNVNMSGRSGASVRPAGKGNGWAKVGRLWLMGGGALVWTLASAPCWAQSAGAEPSSQAVPVPPGGAAENGGQSALTMATPPEGNPPATLPEGTHHSHHHGEEEPSIVVSSRPLAPDPAKAINQASFDATQVVDGKVIEPLSKGYEAIVPSPARDGLHNAIYNLREPIIAANFLLQHKIGKTGETLARFVINSTLGVAGLFDIAKRKPFRLRYRENGFADTLGFYGVSNGPYIYVPLFGATTLRDLTGRLVDRAVLPLAIGRQVLPTAAVVPMIVIGILDRRLVNKERLRQEREADDPYTTTRDNYLRRRADEINGLRHPHAAPEGKEKQETPEKQPKPGEEG